MMRVPMLGLAAACVVIGLLPWLFWPALAHAMSAWSPEGGGFAIPAAVGPDAIAPLRALSACHLTLAVLAAVVVTVLLRQVRDNGVARAGTWDCGYVAPTARMQYTAGSFAEIITGWFAWILRPQRHGRDPAGLFAGRALHAVHTPETVLEHVVEPVGRFVLALSTRVRRLQHGRLQFYILYLVVGVFLLAALVVVEVAP
jgi:hydrogenase-4 component B